MLLYHFTPGLRFKDILASNVVRASDAVMHGSIQHNAAVSLTTDIDPLGHGLPNGEVLTQTQANKVKLGWKDQQGQLRALVATKWRLDFDIPATDPTLKKASQYHTKKDLLGLQIAALLPYAHEPSALEIAQTSAKIATGAILSKSDTWWVYLGDLPLSLCVGAASELPNGQWHRGTLAEFQDKVLGASL